MKVILQYTFVFPNCINVVLLTLNNFKLKLHKITNFNIFKHKDVNYKGKG